MMKRVDKMIFIYAALSVVMLSAALLMAGCALGKERTGDPVSAHIGDGKKAYAVKTTLKELTEVDPEKGLGVYGRYTELRAEGEVPEVLSKLLSEANARAKESVETRADKFLSDNGYQAAAEDPGASDGFRYRNISYIVNVTRADETMISILETEMDSGIGDAEGESIDETQSCIFHASVYDTQSGEALTIEDFLKDQGSVFDLLREALKNKYGSDGLFTDKGEVPAWTADYLGLRFYFDAKMIPQEEKSAYGIEYGKAIHVSIPYEALDGPMAGAAAKTPECFIAQIEKNTEYSLPDDKRTVMVEKAEDQDGIEAYRVVTKNGKDKESWWLEYADDNSDYYLFRTQDGCYFYRLEDAQDTGYVYDFKHPDGGFERFSNQNAQCFDSFLHELYLAVPYNPECVHMRERARRFMDAASALNTSFAPNGHYSFLPEPGRGSTWLHFALIDDTLMLDSHNVGCRLLHDISATEPGDGEKEDKKTVVPAGEVLKFLHVDGESEIYYYMSKQYDLYHSGARDYSYDCMLSDGKEICLVTRYENSFFVDGMYMDRIGEPVRLSSAQYETGLSEIPEHYVEIGGKKYTLIRDLSLKTEAGEEIDFDGDIWWQVENYVGTFSSREEDAKLVISQNGNVRFDYEGTEYTGKLPEKRYYRSYAEVSMKAGYEERTFVIIVKDQLPDHDPSFKTIAFYSEGLPATNEPSTQPPIEVELTRE